MRSGNLDRLISVERATTGISLDGTPTGTWSTVASMRAQLLQHATDDKEGQRGHTTDVVRTFRTRWLDGVSLETASPVTGSSIRSPRSKSWAGAGASTSRSRRLGHDLNQPACKWREAFSLSLQAAEYPSAPSSLGFSPR